LCIFFFLNDTATTEIYTLSLHDALPISWPSQFVIMTYMGSTPYMSSLCVARSEEHTSELQSHLHLVCRLLLEKKRHAQSHGRGRVHPNKLLYLVSSRRGG